MTIASRIQHALDSSHRLIHIFATIERAQAEVTLAGGTKTAPGRSNEVSLIEQLIEELPTRRTGRRFQPDVGRIFTPVNLDSDRLKS